MNISQTLRRGGSALALVLALATPGISAGNQGLLEPIGAIGSFMDDTGITAEVKARLLAQKGLDGLDIHVTTEKGIVTRQGPRPRRWIPFDIHVTTEKGIVTLSGLVDTTAQIDLAGRIAADPSNVKGVNNTLKLKQ